MSQSQVALFKIASREFIRTYFCLCVSFLSKVFFFFISLKLKYFGGFVSSNTIVVADVSFKNSPSFATSLRPALQN